MRGRLALPVGALLLSLRPAAAMEVDWYAFMTSVGCSRLPMLSCELLTPSNAQNIGLTYRALLSSRFCGTGNFAQAKQLLELDVVSHPHECRALVELVEREARGAAAPPPKPEGGVKLGVTPDGSAGDLSDIRRKVLDPKARPGS